MQPVDLLIIVVYLTAVIAAGAWFGKRQNSTNRYFFGGRNVPWWAVSASIVATETSTITFISVPGIVYAKNGNYTFLQLVFGYLLGRVVISFLFMPSYFRGSLVTVYELLQDRFGARVKALAASLFVCMRTIADSIRLLLTAIVVRPNWSMVLRDTVIPTLPRGKEAWSTLVAILGTTISPYLFFWQSSQEVEEEKIQGRTTTIARRGATDFELLIRRIDVVAGAFFSNLVMFFIIVTTAVTLHSHGITHIETTRQAAEALRPLAGAGCFLLFTAGVIGTGLLAIPTLSGSAAYALAETFGWKQGLDEKVEKARAFYAVVLLSIAMGIAPDFARINPVQALYWSAILNGLLAPFLLVGILIVSNDREIMHNQPSSRPTQIVVGVTTVAMFAAGIAMFVL